MKYEFRNSRIAVLRAVHILNSERICTGDHYMLKCSTAIDYIFYNRNRNIPLHIYIKHNLMLIALVPKRGMAFIRSTTDPFAESKGSILKRIARHIKELETVFLEKKQSVNFMKKLIGKAYGEL